MKMANTYELSKDDIEEAIRKFCNVSFQGSNIDFRVSDNLEILSCVVTQDIGEKDTVDGRPRIDPPC